MRDKIRLINAIFIFLGALTLFGIVRHFTDNEPPLPADIRLEDLAPRKGSN